MTIVTNFDHLVEKVFIYLVDIVYSHSFGTFTMTYLVSIITSLEMNIKGLAYKALFQH